MSHRNLQSGILLILLFCGVVTATGCEESSPKVRKEGTSERDTTRTLPAQYHFQAKYKDVAGLTEVLINGFPVNRSGGSITDNPVVPHDLNTALIGEGNELTIRVEPRILLVGDGLTISTVKVYGTVTRDYEGKHPVPGAKITEAEIDSVYERWSERAQKKWKDYRTTVEQGALDSIRAWAERNPLTVTTTFDNEAGPDFSKIFEEAPRLPDTPATRERLRDYAMRLRDLMAEKDTTALYKEAQPLFTDRDTGEPASRERILEIIGSNWFARDWQLDFTREEVGLRRWSGGRVWELYQKESGEEFFVGENGTSVLDIYVAEIGGDLTVVR
jgi:hypothetical protein